MGNTSSNINAIIVFDQQTYIVNDTATGNIHIQIKQNTSIKRITLSIIGLEKSKWHSSDYFSTAKTILNSNPSTTDVTEDKYVKSNEQHLFTKEATVDLNISSGNYSIPFRFDVPYILPTSFEYITDTSNNSIIYYAEVDITADDGTHCKFQEVINIRQSPNERSSVKEKKIKKDIQSFCGQKGEIEVVVRIDKYEYLWNDMILLDITVNKAKCDFSISQVNIDLIQKTNLRSSSGSNDHLSRKVCSTSIPFICNENITKDVLLEMRLINADNPTIKNKAKSNNYVLLDDDVIEGLDVTTKGNFVSNEFYICISFVFDGNGCCYQFPLFEFPILIVPNTKTLNYQTIKPVDWNPNILNEISLRTSSTLPSYPSERGFNPFNSRVKFNVDASQVFDIYKKIKSEVEDKKD